MNKFADVLHHVSAWENKKRPPRRKTGKKNPQAEWNYKERTHSSNHATSNYSVAVLKTLQFNFIVHVWADGTHIRTVGANKYRWAWFKSVAFGARSLFLPHWAFFLPPWVNWSGSPTTNIQTRALFALQKSFIECFSTCLHWQRQERSGSVAKHHTANLNISSNNYNHCKGIVIKL